MTNSHTEQQRDTAPNYEILSTAFGLSLGVAITSFSFMIKLGIIPSNTSSVDYISTHFLASFTLSLVALLWMIVTAFNTRLETEHRKLKQQRFVALYISVFSALISIVGVLLFVEGCAKQQCIAEPVTPFSSLQVLGALTFFLMSIVISYRTTQNFAHRYFTHWADPNAHVTGAPLSWADIKRLLGDLIAMATAEDEGSRPFDNELPAKDPVNIRSEPRALHILTGLPRVLFTLLVGATFIWFGERIVLSPSVIAQVAGSVDLTATLAIIGALSAFAVAAYQVKGRVKAASRQDWINEVRNIITNVVDAEHINRYISENPNQPSLNTSRLKLELLLNPSELEHRVLLSLVRRKLGICIPYLDQPIFKSMGVEKWGHTTQFRKINGDTYDQYTDLPYFHNQLLISMIVRLSQIVLKREWERVKDAR